MIAPCHNTWFAASGPQGLFDEWIMIKDREFPPGSISIPNKRQDRELTASPLSETRGSCQTPLKNA
jgi:hypothetical protein